MKHKEAPGLENNNEEESKEEKRKREEWEILRNDLKNLRSSIFKKAKLVLGDEYGVWIADKYAKFASELKKSYPGNIEKYVAFHVLASSTTEYEQSPELDFPEPDSVKSFFEECEKELDEIDRKNKEEK